MALGDLNILGDVTKTVMALLPDVTISLESPPTLAANTDDGGPGDLNLYLYQVLENPDTKNRNWITRSNGRQDYPPLALNLYYLLTPYATDAISAQQVLTYAMRRLYDNSIVRGEALADSLRLSVEQLAIILCPMEIEELTRIWNAFQTPYRLSVSYEVRIVLIKSGHSVMPSRVMVKHDVYQQQ